MHTDQPQPALHSKSLDPSSGVANSLAQHHAPSIQLEVVLPLAAPTLSTEPILSSYTKLIPCLQVTGTNSQLIAQVVQDLNSQFALKILGEVSYFLGFEVYRNKFVLLLTRSKYAQELLAKANMSNCEPCSTPMALGTKLVAEDGKYFDQPTLYRSIIGGLQYLTLSRPDIAFTINKLSQFLQQPKTSHWTACNEFQDWASDVNGRKSTSGYAIFPRESLVQWSSKKQKVVSLSSIEIEYRFLSQATTKMVWIQHLKN
ncbi:uncharacterized protein LOC116124260 [Pistacia vera]|uniref:uncharacterized protein LOC116124260 n=1 Tax=Pistacia vera TaxID=55513 RepID=UPI001263314B|nr:uncharacterized protein LOC116124260 [Pistacia vera]